MVSAILVTAIVLTVLSAVLGGAYAAGLLDPVIEQIGTWVFKAKAQAEKKKSRAQGLKEGQDFFEDQLQGNEQATEAARGFGKTADFKKGL